MYSYCLFKNIIYIMFLIKFEIKLFGITILKVVENILTVLIDINIVY